MFAVLLVKFSAIFLVLFLALPASADRPYGDDAAAVPAWIIQLPDSVTSVLIADTSDATLHRYARGSDGLSWQDDRYMSIGQKGVRKERAWDKKTPLGNYFITERLDTAKLHDKYGAAAFPLDYPNTLDRLDKRSGYGIWLHGVDKNSPDRPPLDTDGCLALPNDALLQLAQQLKPLVTPVIVTPNMRWSSVQDIEDTRLALNMVIDQWQQAIMTGDLRRYLSLYSDEFRYQGMDIDDWVAYRMKVFSNGAPATVKIRDLVILREPAEEDLFLSRFTLVYGSGDNELVTTKRLYWRKLSQSRWEKIIFVFLISASISVMIL